jgi:2-methylcitrate dehydratase PrpD
MNTTEKLAEFIVGTEFEDIPYEVIGRAKELLLDAMGAAIAGSHMPVTSILVGINRRDKGSLPGKATAIGCGFLTSVEEASLINGTSLHCTEFEAVPRIGEQQPAFTVFGSLGMAEALDLSGKDVLEGFILGFELHGRLSANAPGIPARGGWGCVTGTLGAAAAAGRVLKLNNDQMRMALGFAASQTSGLIEHVGTSAHYIELGIGVSHGVRSAMWVKEGLTAMRDIVEHPKGFCAFYAGKDGYDLNGIVRGLGNGFFITDPGVSIKKYPCCMRAHCAIDATIGLVKENGISYKDVREIEVGENFYVHSLLKYQEPASEDQAKYCMEHCLAAVLVDGKIDENTFSLKKIRDLREARTKIRVVMHPEWPPERGAARTPVTIRLSNGKEYSRELDKPTDPIRQEIIKSYKERARTVISDKDIDNSVSQVMELEKVKKIKTVMELIRGRN